MKDANVYSIATVQDIPAMCDLLGVLLSQEAEFSADRELQHRGLNAIMDAPDKGQLFVARRDDSVVGMVNLLYSLSTALGAPVAVLEDMVVLPTFRNQGIGSGLIAFAIQHARQQGIQRITVLSDHDNQLAHRFYQRHGFGMSSMIPLRLSLN